MAERRSRVATPTPVFFRFSLVFPSPLGTIEAMKTTTKYPKSIKPTLPTSKLLKPGSNNKKLGWNVTARKWKGAKLFSLTLTERATCPTSCHHWDDCYGNNMPFAHRFDHTHPDFLAKLEYEIATLCAKHKGGIVIRLHVLGDFYSVDYVSFWERMLETHETLRLFGYTAHDLDSKIGFEISMLNKAAHDRCVIRHSQNTETTFDIDPWFAANESFEGKSFDCPEQTGKIDSCASCGACWQVPTTVRFMSH